MGVESEVYFQRIKQDDFYQLDKLIMGFSFNLHNELGHFCDESIYQEQLYRRCFRAGLECKKEVLIKITYKDFVKSYFIDLLIEDGVIYETKTVKSLNEIHRQQVINYLLLANLNHGKLVNFRPASVESEFVSTKIDKNIRREFLINSDGWIDDSQRSKSVRTTLTDLLTDWGVFLDFRLYNEALIHFMGGKGMVVQPVRILVDNKVVGKQQMQLIDEETVLHVSGISRAFKGHEKNIRKLLEHTELTMVQWINFNKSNVTLKTIKK